MTRYLQSVERGFSYYDTQYFGRGRVAEDMLVFFANWQSQACRLLFECTQNAAIKRDVADYVCRMHDQIIERGFYEDVERRPTEQTSVEVACALEGLNDAYAFAHASDDKRAQRYQPVHLHRAWRTCSGCNAPPTERKGSVAVSA